MGYFRVFMLKDGGKTTTTTIINELKGDTNIVIIVHNNDK